MTPILETRDVYKAFRISAGVFRGSLSLHAVNGVSIGVSPGSVFGLVGESGCGKSTLAELILGLQPPTSGEIRCQGKRLTGLSRKTISRLIQPVFQDPYASLNPRKSVLDIVSLPLRVHRICNAKEAVRRVEQTLDVVGLSRRVIHNFPNQLSGGQRQRVAVARALIMRPSVVICDEPTSALDVSVQAQILNLLMELRAEFGLTYILISHDLSVVEHLAETVAVMYLGRVVESAKAREIFHMPRHPYTRALLASVLTPQPGLGLPEIHLGAGYPNPIDPPPGCSFHPRCPRAENICKKEPPVPQAENEHRVECHFPFETTPLQQTGKG